MNPEDWVQVLRALADKTRLRMIRALLDQDLTVTELAEKLDVSQYNISKHLRVLREAKIIRASKQGTYTYCRLAREVRQRVSTHPHALDFGCCMFRFDEMN
ncbi:MAG: ArsR/SmtB family transcription factor [Candidatus Binatia bacterium]